MSERAQCEACDVVRTLKKYEGVLPASAQKDEKILCSTCANTVNLDFLMHDSIGKVLLQINSKLDVLSRQRKERG